MRRLKRLCFLSAVLSAAGLGCNPMRPHPAESGSAVIEVQTTALSAADIARLVVTVSGAGISPDIVRELSEGPENHWSGTIHDIPAGSNRTFSAQAFDSNAVLIYIGSATGVTIDDGGTAAISIFLQQATPPPPFQNTVPTITSFVASALSTVPGGQLRLTVQATDPDPGDTLSYAWTATAGSFDSNGSPSNIWTAPGSQGSYEVAVSVSDPHGAVATVTGSIAVRLGGVGAAAINISINTSPTVLGLVPSPTRIGAGELTHLDLTVVDQEGDSLIYTWSSDCDGSFDSIHFEDPAFSLRQVTANYCTLTVAISDSAGGNNQAHITIETGAGAVLVGPDGGAPDGGAPDGGAPDSGGTDGTGSQDGGPSTIPCNESPGPLYVSGGIMANTAWCAQNSPIVVTGNVVVFPDVALVIRQGVTVRIQSPTGGGQPISIEIRGGALHVQGTEDNPVVFTSGAETPGPGSWVGIEFYDGSIDMSHGIVEYADTGLFQAGGPVRFSELRYNNIGSGGAGMTSFANSNIHHNTSTGLWAPGAVVACDIHHNGSDGVYGYGQISASQIHHNSGAGVRVWTAQISDSTITDNQGWGLSMEYYSGSPANSVANTTFAGNANGVLLRYPTALQFCLITGSAVGVEYYGGTLANNTIAGNQVGVRTNGDIHDNNICNNTQRGIELTTSSNANIGNNYWCTTNETEISTAVWDAFDNVALGIATFEPYRSAPVPGAPGP